MARNLAGLALLLCAAAPLAARPAPPGARRDRLPEGTRVEAVPVEGQRRDVDETVDARAKALEERVADLRQRIVQTKARLADLQALVLGGDLTAGARTVLIHRSEMGGDFVLESAAYLLDGAPIFTRADVDGDLARSKEIEVFDARLPPGSHQIAVRLVYRGRGDGEGYRFKVRSARTFRAEPGRVTTVRAVSFEKRGEQPKDRPAVRYEVDARGEEGAPAAAAGGEQR